MLGKLSRFLRFLGYDTLYRRQESVKEMLDVSSEENRIVLTKSEEIIRMCTKRNIDKFLISDDGIIEQLSELKDNLTLELDYPPLRLRCSVCNGELKKRAKEEILAKIPEGTAKNYDDFWQCMNCSKIYWMGSHWQDIKKTLSKIDGSKRNAD
jgi:uncharacterized protein with PIN domain